MGVSGWPDEEESKSPRTGRRWTKTQMDERVALHGTGDALSLDPPGEHSPRGPDPSHVL